jgi:phosphorylcholine metabolism protein LicD
MHNGVPKEKFEQPLIQPEYQKWSMESSEGVAGDDRVVISNQMISQWIRER